jgi:hypothetical protein
VSAPAKPDLPDQITVLLDALLDAQDKVSSASTTKDWRNFLPVRDAARAALEAAIQREIADAYLHGTRLVMYAVDVPPPSRED